MKHGKYTKNRLGILKQDDKYEPASINELNIAYKKINIRVYDLWMQGCISKETYDFLYQQYPVRPIIFGILKIHKNTHPHPSGQ